MKHRGFTVATQADIRVLIDRLIAAETVVAKAHDVPHALFCPGSYGRQNPNHGPCSCGAEAIRARVRAASPPRDEGARETAPSGAGETRDPEAKT